MNNRFLSILALMFTMLLVSCSGTPPMQRDYADAVTNINQVDPYYRSFFRSQNASNYTLADQRRAYFAAMQTARTPVRARDYQRAVNTRMASRSTRKAYSKRRAVASRKSYRGKKVSARRATAKRGKTTAKRRATASRRSSARRSSRRRG